MNLVAAWGWKQLLVLLGVLALTTTLFSVYGWTALRRRRVRQSEVAAGTSEATPFVAIGGVAMVFSALAVAVLLIVLLAVWLTN